jgi:hypothetical protein
MKCKNIPKISQRSIKINSQLWHICVAPNAIYLSPSSFHFLYRVYALFWLPTVSAAFLHFPEFKSNYLLDIPWSLILCTCYCFCLCSFKYRLYGNALLWRWRASWGIKLFHKTHFSSLVIFQFYACSKTIFTSTTMNERHHTQETTYWLTTRRRHRSARLLKKGALCWGHHVIYWPKFLTRTARRKPIFE